MKLSLKIYLVVFLVSAFTILGCFSGVLIMSYRNMVEREETRGLDEHTLITNTLASHMDNVWSDFSQDTTLMRTVLTAAAENYAKYYTGRDVMLRITDASGAILHSSIMDEDIAC